MEPDPRQPRREGRAAEYGAGATPQAFEGNLRLRGPHRRQVVALSTSSGVGRLAIGDRDHDRFDTDTIHALEQAACTEDLVIGMRRHDNEPTGTRRAQWWEPRKLSSTRARFSRRSQGAYRQRLAPWPPITCHVAKDIGILRAVVLSEIHIQIGHPLGLFRIEAEGPSSPGRRGMHQNLLCCVVHRVTNDKGPSLRIARTVAGIVINLPCCRIDCPAHEINVGDRMSELGQDGLRRMWTNAAQHFLDKTAGAAVPAGGDSSRPEPESRALKVKVGRSDGTARRHRRPSEIEGLAQ